MFHGAVFYLCSISVICVLTSGTARAQMPLSTKRLLETRGNAIETQSIAFLPIYFF